MNIWGKGWNEPGASDAYQDLELTPARATRTKAEAWMNFMMVVKGEERETFRPSLYTSHDCVGCPSCDVRHPRRHAKLLNVITAVTWGLEREGVDRVRLGFGRGTLFVQYDGEGRRRLSSWNLKK